MKSNFGSDLRLAGTRTILVIDDVGVVRKVAFHLLSEAGYRVFEAAGAEDISTSSMSKAPAGVA